MTTRSGRIAALVALAAGSAHGLCHAQTTEYASVVTGSPGVPPGMVQMIGDNAQHSRVAISGDGNRVVFSAGAFPPFIAPVDGDVWIRDRAALTTTKVSSATDAFGTACLRPDISGDGSHATWIYWFNPAGPFAAYICNLDAPGFPTEPVSVPTGVLVPGTEVAAKFAAVSHDGRFVAFTTSAMLNTTVGDFGNGGDDVYLRDRLLATTVLCSRTPAVFEGAGPSGHLTGPSISSDGRYVVFESTAGDLVVAPPLAAGLNVYRFDRVTGVVDLVSKTADGLCAGNAFSGEYGHDVSADGNRVAFSTWATNLRGGAAFGCAAVDPSPSIMLKDMTTGVVTMVSAPETAVFGLVRYLPRLNKDVASPANDGRHVLYSTFNDQTPPDANGLMDMYSYNDLTGVTTLESISSDGLSAGTSSSSLAAIPGEEFVFAYGDISQSGTAFAWQGHVPNLVGVPPVDMNGGINVYARGDDVPCTIECPPEGVIEPLETASCGVLDGGTNEGCNTAAESFTPIACGVVVCGTAWAANNARDTDWYAFSLAEPAEVTWTVRGTASMRAFLYTPGPNGCPDRVGHGTTSALGCVDASITSVLPVGTHWTWAGTDSFAGVPCDTLYSATLTCVPVGCCTISGSAQLLSAAACAAAGGAYAGDGVGCPPPVNDSCSGALMLTLGQAVTGNTQIATLDAGIPQPCGGSSVYAPGVWYVLQGTGSTVTLSLCAQNSFDSQLLVYGGPCENLTCIAANDDFCQVGGSSQVTFCALAGRTYRILVTGWSYAIGPFSLLATDSGTACGCLPASTTRVSLSSTGGQAIGTTTADQVTPDGRFLALYASGASLVPGDTNSRSDIFVRDLVLGTNHRVSVGPGGGQSNGNSEDGAISHDGRFVSFTSEATNLVAGDTNNTWDVFFHDRQAGTTTRILGPGGVQPNNQAVTTAISGDGACIAFSTIATNLVAGDTNGTNDVFVHDRTSGVLTLESRTAAGAVGNGTSNVPVLSSDGRFIAFASSASNLVAGDTNAQSDVFVRDRVAGTMTRASTTAAGAQATGGASGSPSISSDGRYVAFNSSATNLVAGDTNAVSDVFVKDRQTGAIQRVSVTSGGVQGNAASTGPVISGDGTWIAFSTAATNLVAGDTNAQLDVVIKNRLTGAIERVSVGTMGAEGNNQSWVSGRGAIFGSGRLVVFNSWASTLIPSDTNNQPDAFLRDRGNLVAGGPTIWTQPNSISAVCGGSAALAVFAQGVGALTYQWRHNAVPLVNAGPISGATTSNLTIGPIAAAHAGTYDCVVTDACGSVTTAPAMLTISTCCPADFDDGSGTGSSDGAVDIADLLYYLSIFGAGDLDADLDDGSGTGAPDGSVDISDFLYFLTRFDQGC